jgi:dTDP-4-amino-4,6-dideoxygalactose transaminase
LSFFLVRLSCPAKVCHGDGVFYPRSAHRFPHVYDVTGELDLPVTDRVAASVLSLPVHPLLEPSDLERIAAAVNSL